MERYISLLILMRVIRLFETFVKVQVICIYETLQHQSTKEHEVLFSEQRTEFTENDIYLSPPTPFLL